MPIFFYRFSRQYDPYSADWTVRAVTGPLASYKDLDNKERCVTPNFTVQSDVNNRVENIDQPQVGTKRYPERNRRKPGNLT